MALSDGREFLADNRAGRIAPAQLTALQDSYSLKELGLGPVARLLRKDAALGRDLEARVVAHFDGAVKPEERDLKQTLTKFAVGAAIEIGSAFLLGTRVGNESSGSKAYDSPDLSALQLYGADRMPRRFLATGPQHRTIEEHGLVRVHHLPESGRILSVEPLPTPEPVDGGGPAQAGASDAGSLAGAGDPTAPADVPAAMARAKEAQDWFAIRMLQRSLPGAGRPIRARPARSPRLWRPRPMCWADGRTARPCRSRSRRAASQRPRSTAWPAPARGRSRMEDTCAPTSWTRPSPIVRTSLTAI